MSNKAKINLRFVVERACDLASGYVIGSTIKTVIRNEKSIWVTMIACAGGLEMAAAIHGFVKGALNVALGLDKPTISKSYNI